MENCREMMEEIPDRLKRVIDQEGEQIHNHSLIFFIDYLREFSICRSIFEHYISCNIVI